MKFKDNKTNEIIKIIFNDKNESFISSEIKSKVNGKAFSISPTNMNNIIGIVIAHPRMFKFILNDLKSLNYKIGLIFFLLSSEFVSINLLYGSIPTSLGSSSTKMVTLLLIELILCFFK